MTEDEVKTLEAKHKKLHSEYKSTYRWHEFTPKSSSSDIVKKQPKIVDDFLSFSRKKKHPDLAYKSHELFDVSLAPPFPTRQSRQGRRQMLAHDAAAALPRRAKSEGPPPAADRRRSRRRWDQPQPPPLPPSAAKSSMAVMDNEEQKRSGTRYSSDVSDAPAAVVTAAAAGPSAAASQESLTASTTSLNPRRRGRKSEEMMSSFPPPAPSSKWNIHENSLRQKQMKESASMSHIQGSAKENVQTMDGLRGQMNGDLRASEPYKLSRLYRSEYRVRYRPFSQYEYLDGQFVPSTSNSPPLGEKDKKIDVAAAAAVAAKGGEPWYKEVVELRKQANEFRCRGWGTDLVPPHLIEVYQRQMDEVYEHREALSALALAIATPRPMQQQQQQPREDRSDSASAPATLPRARQRPPRPKTAPPPQAAAEAKTPPPPQPQQPPRGSNNRSLSANRGRSPAKQLRSHHAPPAPAHNSQNAPAAGGWKIPGEAKRHRPTSLVYTKVKKSCLPRPRRDQQESGRVSVAKRPPLPASAAGPPTSAASEVTRSTQPHPPPSSATAAATTAAAAAAAAAVSTVPPVSAGRRPYSRSSSARTGGGSRDASRPQSAIENHLNYFREPVVKSPPEPTRVKSPEGSVRSPDPINWTVPLDTGKTFSVTQSVKDGDSARDSPLVLSDSLLLDCVSGTAVNLGGNSSSQGSGGIVHHHRGISSLAKEAQDFGHRGLTKDSTLTRPEAPAPVHNERVIAEEDPNDVTPTEARPLAVTADPMTTAIYGSLSDAGGGEATNGGGAASAAAAKNVPGTTLKCLEDPSFVFEAESRPSKKPSYRVLEDPFESDVGGMSPNLGARPPVGEVVEGARDKFDRFWSAKDKGGGS